MPARTGKQYLDNLKSLNPEIYLDGRRIAHVTEEPVFAGPLRTIAEQYDLQLDPRYADVCTYESPTTGERLSRSFQPCRSKDDLVAKRRHFKLRADHTFGMMGRSPDFMNAFILGWLNNAETFGELDERFGANARRYYEHVRDNDLFLTHVLINPAIDRSKTSAEQEDPFLHLGKVRETAEGIVVRGAKMLSTMAPLTEELVVVPFGGIAPGDDDYAVVFALPVDTPGLKFICREPVAPAGRTEFDHPLSSRFEEMDCIAVFDDVLVPSIENAVVKLGIDGLRSVLSAAVMQPVIHRKSYHYTQFGHKLWSHSLCCAIACELIAKQRGLEPFKAYLLGLVHDIGKITLFSTLSTHFNTNTNNEQPGYGAFAPLMQSHSSKLSYTIARDWQLPDEICAALLQQVDLAEGTKVGPYAHLLFQANLACEIYAITNDDPSHSEAAQRALIDMSVPADLFCTLDSLNTDQSPAS